MRLLLWLWLRLPLGALQRTIDGDYSGNAVSAIAAAVRVLLPVRVITPAAATSTAAFAATTSTTSATTSIVLVRRRRRGLGWCIGVHQFA